MFRLVHRGWTSSKGIAGAHVKDSRPIPSGMNRNGILIHGDDSVWKRLRVMCTMPVRTTSIRTFILRHVDADDVVLLSLIPVICDAVPYKEYMDKISIKINTMPGD